MKKQAIMGSGGFIRKQQPTQGDVHFDALLTSISIAHFQRAENFVGRRVFPVVPVGKQSDKYAIFPRGMMNRDEMQKRADCTESQRVGYSVSSDRYECDVWSLGHEIGDQRRANTDAPMNPDREAVQLLTQAQLIREDMLWKSEFFTTGVWGTDVTGVSGAPGAGQFRQWDQASSDPIADMVSGHLAIEQSTGFSANTLVLDRFTHLKLKTNAAVVDRIKYSGGVGNGNPANVSDQALAALFDVERIIVAKGIVNSANEGAADSHGFIMGKNALLCYVNPTPGLYQPSAGYTFQWTGLMGQAGSAISRFRDQAKRCDVIEIDAAFDMKVVSQPLGYFFSGTVA